MSDESRMSHVRLAARDRGRRVRGAFAACLVAAALVTGLHPAVAQLSEPSAKPTIVMLHGAFADASGWSEVTRRLQGHGYTVFAPANPLRGVDTDVAYVRSVLQQIEGPLVLVGHSYGGFVLTGAAEGNPNVRALVYVAAFAPAEGDTVQALTGMNPGSGLADPANLVIRSHPGGAEGYINPAAFHEVFAGDLSRRDAAVLATGQRPGDLLTLVQPSGPPAWDDVPSWYVVATQDRTIPPATQRFMAQRAGSTTVEVKGSHVVMISRPGPVARVIEDAASASD